MSLAPKPVSQIAFEQLVQRRQPSFAPVYEPGEPLPALDAPIESHAPEPQADEHPYDVLRRLPHLSCNLEQRQRQHELIAAAAVLVEKAEAFEREVLATRSAELEIEWKRSKASCREQAKVVARLDNDWKSCEGKVQAAIGQQRHELVELQAISASKLGRWPSDAQIAAREQAIDAQKQRVADANRDLQMTIAQRSQIEEQQRLALKKMNDLAAEEQRLAHAVSGKPYHDLEFGLQVK